MNAELEIQIRTTQHKMLRWIIGFGRKIVKDRAGSTESESSSTTKSQSDCEDAEAEDGEGLEPWADWIRRSTAIAEHLLDASNIED